MEREEEKMGAEDGSVGRGGRRGGGGRGKAWLETTAVGKEDSRVEMEKRKE